MGVLKLNSPFLVIARSFPPLFRSTRLALSNPLTVPPMVKLLVVQETLMPTTFALPTVPEPFVTVQVWLGVAGCVRTLAGYAAPLASCLGHMNALALGFSGRFP